MLLQYSEAEYMVCVAARILEDRKSVFVGTGMPLLAACLAQKLYTPNLVIVFEAGGIAPILPRIPISVGESTTFYGAIMATSMDYVMSLAQAGYVDYGFLGAAQIDPYGNINTTVIGDWERPKVRLPGSGGANDVGSLCWKNIVLMRQDKRRFVPKLDFLTTPGYLCGNREEAGLPAGTGPYRVITQIGVYEFDENTKRMKLAALHEGYKVEDVEANTSFDILIPDEIEYTEPPTDEELEVLKEFDPDGILLGKKNKK
ncbi:MAG: 3-oxoacid CoA-transferase [Archaeoglobus sp.]|uniref:CoA-transferase subunit beta n=1 Tax=Archaeoglobus sp. TaxID=1872626 RepID=UPI001DF49E8A|nr:CoA-transferase [Archaeoglobus sp.]MBO8180878.1 3-oxoacid CoA-transferase [Archaeoglobus sp.]